MAPHPQDRVTAKGERQADGLAPDLREALDALRAKAPTPVAIIDVDEVLGLFIQGFDGFLRTHGHELRMTSFALFANLYPLGAVEPADKIVGKALFDAYFAEGCGEMEVAPGAAEALARVSERAAVVILTNAPECSRSLRGGWLTRHGLPYPLIVNAGPKGPVVAALAEAAGGPAAFVDDLLPNLDSVAEHAPAVARFQMVADPALRPMAPGHERHARVDDWATLAARLQGVLQPS